MNVFKIDVQGSTVFLFYQPLPSRKFTGEKNNPFQNAILCTNSEGSINNCLKFARKSTRTRQYDWVRKMGIEARPLCVYLSLQIWSCNHVNASSFQKIKIQSYAI